MKKIYLLSLCLFSFSVHANPVEYFSYSACANMDGKKDLRVIAAGTGLSVLEAEANALIALNEMYYCEFGSMGVATEAILSSENIFQCRAGCTDIVGSLDPKRMVEDVGRNKTEGAYKALKKAVNKGCRFTVKFKDCRSL